MIWERSPTPLPTGRVAPVVEPSGPGLIDHLFAWAAMAPLILGAAAAWLTSGDVRSASMSLVIIWGGAILAFLAGVRRGLGLRTPGGLQIAMMLWVFGLAIGSMVALRPMTSLVFLIVGFSSLGLADRVAAARAQTPLVFAALPPVQMAVGALSLGAVAVRLMTVGLSP